MKARSFRASFILGAALALSTHGSRAQGIQVERAHTFIVGSPSASFREDRADASRSGLSRTTLPTGTLRTLWSIPLKTRIQQAPVVDEQGAVYVVDGSGEVESIAIDGAVRWRVDTGATGPGPLALLADGTLLFVDSSGRVFAVREGSVRWTVALGTRSRVSSALALEDGGGVVSSGALIIVFDVEGGVRARTAIPGSIVAPLVASSGRIFAVDGAVVWSWRPGPALPERVGSFGEITDAVAAFGRSLVAVANSARRVLALDVTTGQAATIAEAGPGELLLGPIALGSLTPDRNVAPLAFVSTPSGDSLVMLGLERRDQARTLLVGRTPSLLSDGGIAPAPAEAHTPLLVDASGTVVFATTAGDVGVVSRGTVDLSSDVCNPHRSTPTDRATGGDERAVPAVVGLAPIRPGALVATCRSGTVVALEGRGGSPKEGSVGGKDDTPNL
ncbi:MAG: PQQ-binding-like beta-propeller repeat protein [Polyangiaceae bacterium]